VKRFHHVVSLSSNTTMGVLLRRLHTKVGAPTKASGQKAQNLETKSMTSRYENEKIKEGYRYIIGCDEVGRGCLAGPVVAAAIILPLVKSEKFKVIKCAQIKDSKLLTPEQREALEPVIKQNCVAWGIGIVEHHIIDEINIHNASLLAMRRAVEALQYSPPVKEEWLAKRDEVVLLVDGKFPIPGITHDQEPIIDGDNKILSIAAASIIAKVYRDNLMKDLHKKYPVYNFAQHKGYATLHHRTMILEHGLSKIHRLSFCENFIQVPQSS
jgi:ribonuclease HII